MNVKTLIGGLVAGVTAFLLGWVIYGMLLKSYFEQNMTPYEGLLKSQPDLWAMGVSNLALGLLLAYVFNGSGVKTARNGIASGAIVFGLFAVSVDMLFYAQMNLFSLQLICVDVLASLVGGALVGAVLGWWFGRGQTAAA